MRVQTPAAAAAALLFSTAVLPIHADDIVRADSHAPIGVMGDHYHDKGEWMFSYRYMDMSMKTNRDGTTDLSPAEVASNYANPFAPPPNLRVVPTKMDMQMHMVGVMYAPNDTVTLMGMLNYIEKDMEHLTYMGPTGTTELGTFVTRTSGMGDSSVSALVRLHENDNSRVHLTAGVTLPTGSTDETGQVLAPTGQEPTLRLPYPMQLGSGSYDLITGLTWVTMHKSWSWGTQWRGILRVFDNDEDYNLGDEHRFTAWGSKLFTPNWSGSARLEYYYRGNIDGMDAMIMAPVQTADPSRQGIKRLDASLGLNFESDGGHRLGAEFVYPLEQDLDGPQLKTDWQVIVGYQFAF